MLINPARLLVLAPLALAAAAHADIIYGDGTTMPASFRQTYSWVAPRQLPTPPPPVYPILTAAGNSDFDALATMTGHAPVEGAPLGWGSSTYSAYQFSTLHPDSMTYQFWQSRNSDPPHSVAFLDCAFGSTFDVWVQLTSLTRLYLISDYYSGATPYESYGFQLSITSENGTQMAVPVYGRFDAPEATFFHYGSLAPGRYHIVANAALTWNWDAPAFTMILGVPTPASVSLLGLGGLVVARRRR